MRKELGSHGHSDTLGRSHRSQCERGVIHRRLPTKELSGLTLSLQEFNILAHYNNNYYLLTAYSSTSASGASCD